MLHVGWGVVVAHEILVSAEGPLVLVLILRVWGQGLTILHSMAIFTIPVLLGIMFV